MREIKFRAYDTINKKWVDAFDKITVADEEDLYWSWMTGLSGDHLVLLNDVVPFVEISQYTGLKDRNGLTYIYEGDILDENGLVKGNVYESPQIYINGIDHIITKMGTESWRGSESVAMGRGCKYAEQ